MTAETDLTMSEQRVLDAARELTADGWPATVRQIGQLAGLYSPATVHERLGRLERAGLVSKHPRNPKGGWKAVPPTDFRDRDGHLVYEYRYSIQEVELICLALGASRSDVARAVTPKALTP